MAHSKFCISRNYKTRDEKIRYCINRIKGLDRSIKKNELRKKELKDYLKNTLKYNEFER